MHAFSNDVTQCIDAALACHKICLGMAMTHCLETGGDHTTPQHFRLMIDCAAICATTADFLLHKSQFHREIAQLCATACRACADDCAKLPGMGDCVRACRSCAEHCQKVAA
jgi:hypothetical protein